MRFSTIVIVLLLSAAVAGGYFYFRDTDGPILVLTPASGAISPENPLSLQLEDGESGLEKLTISVSQGEGSVVILDRKFDLKTSSQVQEIDLREAGLKEGKMALQVTATDRSPYHFGSGNTTEQVFTFDYDSRAPMISTLSTAHNLNRGGAGLVVYNISEKPERTGVAVGDLFFPGYNLEGDLYAVFFAFPWFMEVSDFSPRLVAVDAAGNERQTGFYHHANPRKLPRGKINVTSRFLEANMPEFESFFPQEKDLLALFLKVNGELRVQNRQTLKEYGLQTASTPLWEGTFLRQPNAAPMGHFADQRIYYSNGKEIDRQTHLGIDLASVAQAPVMAANQGKVIYADTFGIYGQCVIIDHGLGLQTLYGHLSKISVRQGDEVKKGAEIGRSGATGLAGGDHLHYAVLVSGLPVNPIEWWDGSWIHNNVTSKLSPSKDDKI